MTLYQLMYTIAALTHDQKQMDAVGGTTYDRTTVQPVTELPIVGIQVQPNGVPVVVLCAVPGYDKAPALTPAQAHPPAPTQPTPGVNPKDGHRPVDGDRY